MSNFFLLKKGDSQNKCRTTLISLIACYLLGRAAFSTILAGKFGAFEGRCGYGNLGSFGEKSIFAECFKWRCYIFAQKICLKGRIGL
jgi:hypothetical protein